MNAIFVPINAMLVFVLDLLAEALLMVKHNKRNNAYLY